MTAAPTAILAPSVRAPSGRARHESPLARALADWAHALGAAHVLADAATLARYGRSTGPAANPPLAVLRPGSTEEVQALVAVAARERIPLHPISCGRNWGYGDACAAGPGQVVVDLGRMNRILEVNERLGYAVVEPGVTQAQLHERLRGTGLWMDATGAGGGASLVGNALDRGFGHTRYGDHWQTAAGFEVVLADGRLLRTGFGHYENARARWAYRYGIGPQLDGLFTQSNLGIVTRMGIALMAAPERTCAFFLRADGEDELAEIIDRLAPLRRQGLLQSAIHVGNDLRVISGRTRYPFARTGGATPLPRDLRLQLRREHGVGAWNVAGAIYGTPGIVRETKRQLRRALGRRWPLAFLDEGRVRLLSLASRALSWTPLGRKLGVLVDTARPLLEIVQGKPTDMALLGASWRVRGDSPPPERAPDPLAAEAGLLWVSPVLPLDGAAARELVALMEPIYEKHGFELLATFTLLTERALACVTNVSFDRRVPEEVARAGACYDELWASLHAAGFYPYRTGPTGYPKLARGSSVFWDVAAEIKRALDPDGILAPGRYEPARA